MKNVIRKTIVIAFLAFFATSTFAQDGSGQQGENPLDFEKDQIATIEANKAQNKENKEAFKATLSDEQLAILEDVEMTKQEKKEALKATLTEDQVAMLESNKEMRRELRAEFRSTLTDEQKEQMKGKRRRRGGN